MHINNFTWLTAYSFKRKLSMRYWPWWKFFSIIFDGTEILVICDYVEAKRMTAALNGAYNLGRVQGHFEAKDETHEEKK